MEYCALCHCYRYCTGTGIRYRLPVLVPVIHPTIQYSTPYYFTTAWWDKYITTVKVKNALSFLALTFDHS